MMVRPKRVSFFPRKLLILLVLIGACLLWQEYSTSPKAPENLSGPYPVERVVDGDTIIVQIEGQRVRVRLIGVDCPESVSPQAEKNHPEGVAASDFTKSLLDGTSVYLEYDEERQDRYQRTLAYVYLEDGQTMVERLLLENGYAVPMKVGKNIRYYDEFCKIHRRTSSDPSIFDRILA